MIKAQPNKAAYKASSQKCASSSAPAVSIIMANYNGAAYLGDAIESVLRQTLSSLELIIVDDGSIDESLSVAERYAEADSRIRIFCQPRNLGPAAARNEGLAHVTGDWIAIMDSDDVLHPCRLENLIAAAERDGADIVADDLVIFYSDGSKPTHSLLTPRYAREAFWVSTAEYVRLNTFFGCGPGLGYLKPLIRTDTLARASIRYDETLRIGEDYDFILRLLHSGARYRVYPRQLYYYRKHRASISHRLSIEAARAILAADTRFKKTIDPLDAVLARAVQARIRSTKTAIAFGELIEALKSKRILRALRLMLRKPRLLPLLNEPLRAAMARAQRKIRPHFRLKTATAAMLAVYFGIAAYSHPWTLAEPLAIAELKPLETVESFNRFAGADSTYNPKSHRLYLFKNGAGKVTITEFDPTKGDKLRLQGFGITSLSALRPFMKQAGPDLNLEFGGGQSVTLRNVEAESLSDDCLQLELDRKKLVQTFGDEFDSFSWYAEGLSPEKDRQGRWRTNYGWGYPDAESSRSLPGNLQVYADPAFHGTSQQAFGLNPFHINNGILEIRAEQAPEAIKPFLWGRQYISGLITSKYSFSQLYGVFEIRARMPKGPGFWPAFWLLPVDSTWPPEIDVLEVLSKDPTHVYTTVHVEEGGVHTASGVYNPVPDTTEDFHQYAVDWQKDTIRWYFDGVEIARVPTPATMHKPMYVLANLGVGGDWPGPPDASTPFPGIYAIDWIKVYRTAPAEARF